MDESVKRVFKNSFSLAYKIALIYFIALSIWGIYVRYTETLHDGDIYFSMAYGRQYFHDHTLKIDENQFRWQPYCDQCDTANGLYPSWIPHIMLYLSFKAFGYAGLYLLRFFVIAVIFLMFFLMARELKILEFSGLLLLLAFVALSGAITGLMLKADLFSVLWMSVEAFLLFRYQYKRDKKALFALPVVFLLWANSHISVIVGLGIFAWWSFLDFIANRKKQNFLAFIVVLISFCMIFITPKPLFLFNAVKGPLISYFFTNVFLKAKPDMGGTFNSVMAFAPAHFSFKDVIFLWIFSLSCIFLSLLIIQAFFKRDEFKSAKSLLKELFFLSPFVVFSMKLARMTYAFSIFAIWAIFIGLSRVCDKLKKFVWVINVLSLAILLFFLNSNLLIERERSHPGPGAWVPVLEVEYIRSHIPAGSNVFTTLSAGSYMMWKGYPDYRNYIDSRMGMRLEDYLKLTRGELSEMERPLDEKAYDVAFVSFKEWGVLWNKFIRNEEWKPVFWAQDGVVFVRKKAFPELHWTNPDFRKLARHMQWPYYTSRIVMFLLIEGRTAEAKTVLKIAEVTMPEWYKFSKSSWDLIFSVFSSSDIIGALYENILKVNVMPLTLREVVLYLGRRYEYWLFDNGRYGEAYNVEVFIFRFVKGITLSLYNQGLIKWAGNDAKEAKRLLRAYKENVEAATDNQKQALKTAERILGGEKIGLSSKLLF